MTIFEQSLKNLQKNPKKWVITGVAGFIGSNLLEKLLMTGQTVIGIDNFETGHQKNIDMAVLEAESFCKKNNILFGSFEFLQGDIRDLNTCYEITSNADYVLHQAALGSVPRSIDNPIDTNEVNITGFLNMLHASKENNIKRLIYAASSSTYGDHPDLPKVEAKIGNPLSPYAVTKYVNELYAKVYKNVYNIDTIGLRYFNIFGKRQDPNGSYAAVIPKWIKAIMNGEEVFINGDGTTSRDFCYIDNAIQMNILAATTSNINALNEIYNVAVGDRTSLTELYNLISSDLAEKISKKVLKEAVYRDFRPGDVKHSLADISKAKRLLGYAPSHNIIKGLEKTIDWYVR